MAARHNFTGGHHVFVRYAHLRDKFSSDSAVPDGSGNDSRIVGDTLRGDRCRGT